MFKECSANGIVPFIIEDERKVFYYRGFSEWDDERGFLRDVRLAPQGGSKTFLEHFRIPFTEWTKRAMLVKA